MSKHFKPGDIVLVVGAVSRRENIGKEVEVVSPLSKIRSRASGEVFEGYKIRTPDGKVWGALPEHLWKKPPKGRRPRLGIWNECPFKPVGVRV